MKEPSDIFNILQPPQPEPEPEYVEQKILRKANASDDEIIIQEKSPTREAVTMVKLDCGCKVSAWFLAKNPNFARTSYTGKEACAKLHAKECDSCKRILCIAGNSDGKRIDYIDKTYWYCYPNCYEIRREVIIKENFWEEFKRGLLWQKNR
jgi:hypothetical protein